MFKVKELNFKTERKQGLPIPVHQLRTDRMTVSVLANSDPPIMHTARQRSSTMLAYRYLHQVWGASAGRPVSELVYVPVGTDTIFNWSV